MALREKSNPSSAPMHILDGSKRKRVNRSAKLKQCKLDARREQWLAQGKHGKAVHHDRAQSLADGQSLDDTGEVVNGNAHESPSFHQMVQSGRAEDSRAHLVIEQEGCRQQLENSSRDNFEVTSCLSECSEVGSSPKSCGSQSPKSKIIKWDKEDTKHFSGEFGDVPRNVYSTKSSKSDNANDAVIEPVQISSPRSKSGAYSDEDDDADFESAEDDWEAAADALELSYIRDDSTPSNEAQIGLEVVKSDAIIQCRKTSLLRAWRPDDVTRPSSLPSLNKQKSFPGRMKQKEELQLFHCEDASQETNSAPSLCPICTEELDKTDSLFEPCPCGFQVCLFCHHRIASDDGRCPGCRKSYNSGSSCKSIRSAKLN